MGVNKITNCLIDFVFVKELLTFEALKISLDEKIFQKNDVLRSFIKEIFDWNNEI